MQKIEWVNWPDKKQLDELVSAKNGQGWTKAAYRLSSYLKGIKISYSPRHYMS
ncbi:conserved hypothetical protein [Ricinus communis]|uniref:Uncharacterized protein n=1 Tax=Ricinus communis TaxID=3988 RepID=B9T5D6_RICCO|nr:conserved hypothetical protein [Ricinus communis]